MVTTGAKFWFGVAAIALAAGLVYVVASDGEGQGTLVLLALVVAAVVLGVLTVAVRDGDVPAAAEPAPSRRSPATMWPALGALGLGVTALGAATGGALLYVGFGLLGVTVLEWMVQGWAERATGDEGYNTSLRNRLMFPLEIPVLGLLGAVVVLGAFSRVLLALPKAGSTVIAIVVASVILGAAALVAARPRISSSLVAGVSVLGAVALLGGGVVGAVAGEREVEEHEEEAGGEEGEGGEADVEITITADGFDPAEVTVPVGQPVRIRFVNDDEEGQAHSLQIQGVDGEPTTGSIEGGESKVIEITAPTADTYQFIDGVSAVDTDPGRLVAEEGAELGEGVEVPEAPAGAEPSGGDSDLPSGDEDSEDPDGGESDPDDTTEVSSP